MEEEVKKSDWQSSFKERMKNVYGKVAFARNLNQEAVSEEKKRNELPPNWEAKKRRGEWFLNDQAQKEEAERKGIDYERLKTLNMTALEAQSTIMKKKKKKNPDQGFADYEQATARQHTRLVQQLKPDLEEYERQKQQLGSAFYGDKNTILHGLHKDSKESINKMVEDLQKQIAKRAKYSRRRAYNDDEDIDHINERNMKFNKKLERFYGEHTLEIKQNLERGTAV